MKNFAKSLVAVLLGNAAYFLVMPHLPPAARHKTFQIDLGLAVDAWFCLVFYGLVEMVVRVWSRRARG